MGHYPMFFKVKCSQCGREIYLIGSKKDYLYKKTHKSRVYYFCSWKCMREFEKSLDKEREL